MVDAWETSAGLGEGGEVEWAVCLPGGGDIVATIEPDERAEERCNLIAAAPEMLDTLVSVLLAHDYDGALTMGNARLSPAIRSRVAYVIEKAKGNNHD